ncbi:TasA family protein [Nocardioides sp.]|uniref:TasA family protein n=1 Tax=Nocardioides sp. TaxID=35761 RepID=UPI00272618B7|nr:TasA family protein [Nocardioides sp.]MDO9457447.1 TasA family protein [Nocardioides sp.]
MRSTSGSHAATRPRTGWWARLTSTRSRALLSLVAIVALVPGLGAQGTFAFWTDDATANGGSFTSGTLDLRINDANAYATTTLGMTNMVPGASSAEVLTIKNSGTVPLKYTLTGGLTGADAAIYSSTAVLKLVIRSGGTKTGTGSTSTCTGGIEITTAGGVALTSTTTTSILAKRPTAALVPFVSPSTGIETLCFQVTFDNTIASAQQANLQNKTVAATFTASATTDLT